MKDKERLDKLLPELGLTDTRNRAQALIMAGNVRVNGQVITKAGAMFPRDAVITVEGVRQWAGRGAQKLLRAFKVFPINVEGKVCADFGASTGGFTDVLLANGARKVYAIDVGYGQLLWRLASDSRVVVMDRTNARYLTRSDFPERVEFSSCDVSFISLKLIIPVIDDVTEGDAVVLIKPQFEAGRERISRGVVRDKAVHADVLREVLAFVKESSGFGVAGLTHSPIRGPEGNIEFLCWLSRSHDSKNCDVDAIVDEAHEKLGK
ncbi:MAG: TlyA family RNA methyltransferase [Synergistaceae bacterium]|nr:TlyA family RNA methyltransferase [Synergistaceae bacterium]